MGPNLPFWWNIGIFRYFLFSNIKPCIIDVWLVIYIYCFRSIYIYLKGEVYSIQHYVIKSFSDLRQVGGFHRVLRFFLHKWNWPPRNSWNIVESGVKHHNPNPYLKVLQYMLQNVYFTISYLCKVPFVVHFKLCYIANGRWYAFIIIGSQYEMRSYWKLYHDNDAKEAPSCIWLLSLFKSINRTFHWKVLQSSDKFKIKCSADHHKLTLYSNKMASRNDIQIFLIFVTHRNFPRTTSVINFIVHVYLLKHGHSFIYLSLTLSIY